MTPREESLDLINNPLPEEVEDKFLPTYAASIGVEISRLEGDIDALKSSLSDLYNERKRIIERAVKGGFVEDARFRIVKKQVFGDRICDPKKLKEQKLWGAYETAYIGKIKTDSEVSLQKKLAALETTILVGLADKVFGKGTVDLCSQIPFTERWEIEKK